MKGSCDELLRELLAAEAVLDKLSRKLDATFSERFEMTGVQNPMAILKRVHKIQGEIPELRDSCQELIQKKQELIDIAKQQLQQNRQRLHTLCHRTGCPAPDDQEVHQGFSQALDEWGLQVAKIDHAGVTSAAALCGRDELNKALAASMLR